MERCFSKRVARCPYDKERAKEPTRVGSRDRFAHCASRDANHCSAVHNRDDPTEQVPRHSPDGPSCRAASTTGGPRGGSAYDTQAPESHVHARKSNSAGLDSEEDLSG